MTEFLTIIRCGDDFRYVFYHTLEGRQPLNVVATIGPTEDRDFVHTVQGLTALEKILTTAPVHQVGGFYDVNSYPGRKFP